MSRLTLWERIETLVESVDGASLAEILADVRELEAAAVLAKDALRSEYHGPGAGLNDAAMQACDGCVAHARLSAILTKTKGQNDE